MAVKPGCFAIRREQNLSPNEQLFEGATPETFDAWSEGVSLPLAFDCYTKTVFCPPWYWNRGPGWLSRQGVLQSEESKI